jgi:hypothetical protein
MATWKITVSFIISPWYNEKIQSKACPPCLLRMREEIFGNPSHVLVAIASQPELWKLRRESALPHECTGVARCFDQVTMVFRNSLR